MRVTIHFLKIKQKISENFELPHSVETIIPKFYFLNSELGGEKSNIEKTIFKEHSMRIIKSISNLYMYYFDLFFLNSAYKKYCL